MLHTLVGRNRFARVVRQCAWAGVAALACSDDARVLEGEINPLSYNEIEVKRASHGRASPEAWRAWEYWAHRAGCADLLGKAPR